MKHLLFLTLLLISSALAQVTDEPTSIRVTHGPILGRPTPGSMTIWARTSRPGRVTILYGLSPDKLDQVAGPLSTSLVRDNTGLLTLTGLQPDTRYHYRISDHQLSGSFRTLPRSDDFVSEGNPEGLFNFRFEFACGNNQKSAGDSVGPYLPVYDTLNEQVRDSIHFAILNGDWLYEDQREYPASEWLHQVGLESMDTAPRLVQKAPTIVGVWENYKIYLERGRNLSEWHRHIPTFYTADDHELLNDIYGTAETGYVNRRAVFRDIPMQAWFDYLAWSNPVAHDREAWFGTATLKAESDILIDPEADFTALDLDAMANLHVHWGTDSAGVKDAALDAVPPANPNSKVYNIKEVLGPNQLRIEPAAIADGAPAYSIGRRAYGKFTVSNCDFFILDTRSHRDLHDVDNPTKPGASILGKQQFNWLKKSIETSNADFFFLVSSVNFMVPHVGSGGGDDKQAAIKKDDAWTVFLEEREELIDFLDARDQPAFILTGDLHNSFAIKITENVYEFASGPHNSINHAPMADEGGRPSNGKWEYGPRECDIRWSSYAMEDIPRANRTFPHYCVVQVNNVFNNPVERDDERWFAFPHPQVIFQFHDAFTGELRYSETVIKGLK